MAAVNRRLAIEGVARADIRGSKNKALSVKEIHTYLFQRCSAGSISMQVRIRYAMWGRGICDWSAVTPEWYEAEMLIATTTAGISFWTLNAIEVAAGFGLNGDIPVELPST